MASWATISKKKIIDPKTLLSWSKHIKKQGKTLATLNGSFDLMHAGHLYIIYEASKLADCLLVALNSDASIRSYKSPDRPIIPLESRLQMMSALQFVDNVTWFDEDDPRDLLEIIKPNVHVNDDEYGQDCLEADVVRKHGGRIHVVSKVEGFSTTTILTKVKSLCV